MNRKYSVFLWLILVLGSCNKTNVPDSPAGVDVYIIGTGNLNTSPSSTVARYWKNNKQIDLSFSSEGTFGERGEYASGIAVAGSDLYICGAGLSGRNFVSGSNYIAKYWKNGVSVNLTDGSTVAYASAIGISGSDVYVTGSEKTADLMQINFGKYWKNGVGVILPGGFPSGIAISGNDVYISGLMRDSLTGRETAVYWKNEIPVRLSDGSSNAHANAILIDGSDIYVAGNDGNRAVYWKNQVPVYITDGSTEVSILSIAVEGNDVLVAGNNGTCWKNGIRISSNETLELSGVALAGGSTYVVGNITLSSFPYYDPGYWINNERQTIFDNTSNSTTSQILVVKH